MTIILTVIVTITIIWALLATFGICNMLKENDDLKQQIKILKIQNTELKKFRDKENIGE